MPPRIPNAAKKYSFPPIVGTSCTRLILGSLPGDESLRQVQYYAHPRNVFWRIMGELCGFNPALPYPERLHRLIQAGAALWDVVGNGYRQGSLDQHITQEQPNNIPKILDKAPSIRRIYCNGGASYRYLKRYFPELWQQKKWLILQLPSTSPAAARYTYAEKLTAWRQAWEIDPLHP